MGKIQSTFQSTRYFKLTVNWAVNFSQLIFYTILLSLDLFPIHLVNFFKLLQLLTTLFSRVVNCQLLVFGVSPAEHRIPSLCSGSDRGPGPELEQPARGYLQKMKGWECGTQKNSKTARCRCSESQGL